MKRYVLFHANCADGFAAALAARRWAGREGVFIPCAYGESLPEIEGGAEVAIVDFSFPRAVLVELAGRVKALQVIDHHKTAQEDLAGLAFATFDMGKSGAVLAWEAFNPGSVVPSLMRYVQDRDLWLFKLPRSREINAALASYPFEFDVWLRFLNGVERLAPEGAAILRAQGKQVNVMADGAWEASIGGHLVPCVNATVHASEVGHELCRRFPGKEFSATFRDLGNGRREVSLRSCGDFDVSVVAKELGGGGHKNAAGFIYAIDQGGIR